MIAVPRQKIACTGKIFLNDDAAIYSARLGKEEIGETFGWHERRAARCFSWLSENNEISGKMQSCEKSNSADLSSSHLFCDTFVFVGEPTYEPRRTFHAHGKNNFERKFDRTKLII